MPLTRSRSAPFIPVLTVMVDYGNAPFLWLVDSPDQGGVGENICDGTWWDESFPMSEAMWRKFADWAIEFDRTAFYSDNFDDSGWDWIAFHARGLQLASWLKEAVGDRYRVVYDKPFEDPNHCIDERTEILADGTLMALPPFGNALAEPVRFCQHIVSGGQTGADRGALDFAIAHGYTHGGWAPRGREAEDGPIPLKYQLIELEDGGYRQRTRRNVRDSDGTLILNTGELEGGTLATQAFARQLGKPFLVVPLDDGVSIGADAASATTTEETAGAVAGDAVDTEADLARKAAIILAWLREKDIQKLNVAGPRESKRPGIYSQIVDLLKTLNSAAGGKIHGSVSDSRAPADI